MVSPWAHPVARPQEREGAADHHGGVGGGGHGDVGAHGGGGGLAVGSGDAQGVAVGAHDGPPGLGPLIDGKAQTAGLGDFGVGVVGGGGADDKLRPRHVFGPLADGNGNAQGAQVVHRGALPHVGAGDGHTHPVEDLRQRGHGYPPDAHQVGPAARDEIVVDAAVSHGSYTLSKVMSSLIVPLYPIQTSASRGKEAFTGRPPPEKGRPPASPQLPGAPGPRPGCGGAGR